MQGVGHAGAEDRDGVGQQPVGRGDVAPRPELPHEGDHEDPGLYTARLKPAAQVQGQVIRRGLAARRGEDLDHPEQEDDLRHLGGDGFGKNPRLWPGMIPPDAEC
jgi:hypothetical protein